MVFLASAIAFDDEMTGRITRHQQERPDHWETVEAPYDVYGPVQEHGKEKTTVLWDCVTVYLNNLIYQETEVQKKGLENSTEIEATVLKELDRLISLKEISQADLFIVSNEVGDGLIPENKLGRLFRDVAGRANQRLAQACDHVYLVTAGLSTKLK